MREDARGRTGLTAKRDDAPDEILTSRCRQARLDWKPDEIRLALKLTHQGGTMTTGPDPNAHDMSPEDQYRIARLYEEVCGRLEEMAMIGARVAGFTLTGDMTRKFAPRPLSTHGYDVDVEIVCPPPDVGPCACIYRKADGTWGSEQPCGSGAP